MFVAIYSFNVKQGFEKEFIQSWKELTQLIYQFEGSLGSRLHLNNDGLYIAYAQWPSKAVWENAGNNLPEIADAIRDKMRQSCSEIKTHYELDLIDDLLKDSLAN